MYRTYNKYSVHLFSKTLGLGAENNHVRSSISDQWYFYAKYDKNASIRACFFGERPIARV